MPNESEKIGFLYVVCGNSKYYQEALESVTSLKMHDANAHVTFVCDSKGKIPEALEAKIDNVIEEPIPCKKFTKSAAWGYKASNIYEKSPYDYTLFVDTDTFFLGSFRDTFELLNHFDICLAHGTNDRDKLFVNGKEVIGYTPYNSGIILFRKGDRTNYFFNKWNKLYNQNLDHYSGDQHAMMMALLESECKVYVLQNNWNARFIFPEKYMGQVVLLHGRHSNFPKLADRINQHEGPRLWIPWAEQCIPEGMSTKPLIKMLFKTLKNRLSSMTSTKPGK